MSRLTADVAMVMKRSNGQLGLTGNQTLQGSSIVTSRQGAISLASGDLCFLWHHEHGVGVRPLLDLPAN
ncbi:hypothetical protein BaRGS_00003454, partial [Batillaria attramentaria]